jgi:hypothetical protein
MFDTAYDRACALAHELVEGMEEVRAEDLGIDPRSCSTVYCGELCVAIHKYDKSRFFYYGCGEYVDKDAVLEIGDMIFFSATDSRVAGWLGLEEEHEE